MAIADSIWWTLGNGQTADRLAQVYRRDGGQGRWQRSSSIGYDFLGRKTGMSDADLGNYSYAYNALCQLTRPTDARAKTGCLYYDSLGRMRGRVQRVSNDSVNRSFTYDSYGRLNRESVTIDSLTRTSSYSDDDHHRPTLSRPSVRNPDGIGIQI